MHAFSTFFNNKLWLKSCKVLIYVLSIKKLPFLTTLTWFLILGKIQVCGQGDDHCRRHWPPAAPPSIKYASSCREDERLSSEGKIFSTLSNIYKKFLEPRWGYEFACGIRGLIQIGRSSMTDGSHSFYNNDVIMTIVKHYLMC